MNGAGGVERGGGDIKIKGARGQKARTTIMGMDEELRR